MDNLGLGADDIAPHHNYLKQLLLTAKRLFYGNCGVFCRFLDLSPPDNSKNYVNFDKKIIALIGFDDYYKKFTCKD